MTVSVADGEGGTDTIGVTISVTDESEPPDAPGAPTVAATSGTTDSLDVSWSAPDTTGRPAISDYDVQYRKSGDTAWTDHAHTGTSTTTTIGSLDSGTTYQVQVRATNAEGTSGWSATGTGSTDNSAPAFASDTTTRSVAENTASGANVGAAVTATDADGDTLTYTLDGTDAASFSIVGASGQIQTSAALDFEAKSSYSVTVKADDGKGGTDTIGVTISVTDESEKPTTPATPTVTATSGATDSLDVSWTAPGLNGGPALTGYEVRYRISGSWTDWTHSGTGTSATITGLTASTTYDVQVRALNGETPSDWSSTGVGSTGTPAGANTTLTPSPDDTEVSSPSKAEYSVTFTGAWTTAAATEVPAGAHFSPLIGGVHNDQVTFLEDGGMASAGVESMAEIGGTTTLSSEVEASTNALSVLHRSGNINPTASATLTASLTTDHPRVTLLTMIAPSPDWFVGVSGLSLLDGNGDWVESHTVDLYAWDAGTEDGTEFSLSNAETDPHGVITSLRGVGKFTNEKIATLTFTRGTVTSTDATLSGLGLSVGTLDPAFASGTDAYAASVGNAVAQITVTPETTDDGASVEYFDENDAAIADADGNTGGQQVDLDAGANTIRVKVTAEDGDTTQTYMLTVTRAVAITGIEITSDPDETGPDDDTYAIGDTVEVTVTFSAAVTVDTTNGSPTLELDFEGDPKSAAYDMDASSGAAVVFSYTVAEDDAANKAGVAIKANKLALNSGTIRTGGADADLGHEAESSTTAHLVNGVRPEFKSADVDRTVDASALVLTFGEDLDTGSTPANTAFTVTSNTVTDVAISGAEVTLTLGTAVAEDATNVTLTYSVPQTNPLRSPVGNDAKAITDEAVGVWNALTAEFSSLPESHDGQSNDGSTDFSVRVRFSEAIGNTNDGFVAAFDITGGTIENRRQVGGDRAHLELDVRPTSTLT